MKAMENTGVGPACAGEVGGGGQQRPEQAGTVRVGGEGSMADGKGRQAASGVRIRQDVEAFRVAASRLGLVGPGPAHGPVAIELAPPASEEAIAAVEAEIGRRLPATLRDFFLRVTARLAVAWSLPITIVLDGLGQEHGRRDVVPPPRFCMRFEDDVIGEAYEPVTSDGAITISLDEVARLWRDWQEDLADWTAPDSAETPARRRRSEHVAAWLRHGFPLMAISMGNWLCIDLANAREELAIMVFTIDTPPGALLGQNLIEHLGQQGRLGFPGLDTNLLLEFRDVEASRRLWQTTTAALDVPALKRRRMHLPMPLVIDANGEAGSAWREWVYGLGASAAAT